MGLISLPKSAFEPVKQQDQFRGSLKQYKDSAEFYKPKGQYRKDTDYSSYYEALDMHADDFFKAKSKAQLKALMARYNYLGERNTEHMVDLAWLYFKYNLKKSKLADGSTTFNRAKHAKPKARRRRARIAMEIEGKRYEKGAYIPHKAKLPDQPFKYVDNRGIRVKQATIGIKINGKWYRKGQFIPKKFMIK